MKKKWIVKITLIILSAALLFIIYSAYSIWSYGNRNHLVHSDAAIVLGAAVWDDEPSPVLKERINHAIWLYDNGYVEKIIFTGGKGELTERSEADVSKRYAIRQHVSVKDILTEEQSEITEENLANAHVIAKQNDLKTFTIVSDPLHMKRSLVMAHDLGMDAYSSPTPSTVYQSLNTKLPFLCRELFFYLGYVGSHPFRK